MQTLENNDRNEQARLALHDDLLNGPLILESERGKQADWIYDKIIANLQRDGKDDEAVSWVKLRFIEAPFNDTAINF